MIHDLKTNGATRPTIAEQRQAAHNAPSLPSKPTAARGGQSWRSWVVAAGLGLVVGMTGTLAAVNEVAPLAGAVQVRNAEVTVLNDGSRWFVISSWAMRLPDPKAPASGAPGQ